MTRLQFSLSYRMKVLQSDIRFFQAHLHDLYCHRHKLVAQARKAGMSLKDISAITGWSKEKIRFTCETMSKNRKDGRK